MTTTEHPKPQVSWRGFLLRPAVFVGVLAATTTLAVAVAGVVGGWVSSYYQDRSEEVKARTAVMLEIIKNDDDKSKALRKLIQAGISD
jgi:hypothetical protein